MTACSPAEREFEVPGYKLAALEWGEPSNAPVLALHGWLDNAGSFRLLAPLLDGCHVIAPDAAGQGLSGCRSPDASYPIWRELDDVVEIADQLGWERFSLLGHSRGAAVATLFAGAFPERVDRLLLIEGGLPIVGEPGDTPVNLAQVIERRRELRGRAGNVYASRADAIAERVNGFSPVSAEAAELLAERSLREVAGGWQWQADSALKAGSEVRLGRAQVRAFVERVEAPTIAIFAEDSPFADLDDYADLIGAFKRIDVHRLPGRHHFHLEGQAPAIAAHLLRFLASSGDAASTD